MMWLQLIVCNLRNFKITQSNYFKLILLIDLKI